MNTKDRLTKVHLTAARKLIENFDNWIKYDLAEDAQGCSVSVYHDAACKFCAIGALARTSAGPISAGEGLKALRAALPEGYENIPHLNDEGTHSQVLKLYDDAIAAQGG